MGDGPPRPVGRLWQHLLHGGRLVGPSESRCIMEAQETLDWLDQVESVRLAWVQDRTYPTIGAEAVNCLAADLAVQAELFGVDSAPFANVSVNWWRIDDPDCARAIANLRAKLG